MSAFAIVFERREAAGPADRLARILRPLAHRAVDGVDSVVSGPIGLAHLHFWTTPEEVGERQPLVDPGSGVAAVFCGRIDNRRELLRALGEGERAEAWSDAALFMRAFASWWDDVFARLFGPFVAVVADEGHGRVLCARDVLGDRGLFYHLSPRVFAAASEESALLAMPEVSARLDEQSMARLFAPEEPMPGSTFFADVADLLPGEVIEITASRVRRWRSADIAPASLPRYRRDDEYVAHFRDLLGLAVKARLRGVGTPGVLMSGGLDSTAVAAVAAPVVRSRGGQLRSISYVFDELRDCDERHYIRKVVERSGLAASYVVGDEHWPLRDLKSLPRSPNNPLESPYRRLREQVFRVVRDGGSRVLLTGEFGDELHLGGEYWLADLLRQGRLPEALYHAVADRWWRATDRRPRLHSLRGAVRRAAGREAAFCRSAARPWLTARSLEALGSQEPPVGDWPRRSQAAALLHPIGALGNVSAPYHASRFAIELRRPFRDRRLIEFVLAAPAHLLYRPGQSKWLLRQALRGELAEEVRQRHHPTSLQPLLRRGLVERTREEAARLLYAPDAWWRPFLSEDWMRAAFPQRVDGPDGPALVAIWRALCVELWRQGLARVGVSPTIGL